MIKKAAGYYMAMFVLIAFGASAAISKAAIDVQKVANPRTSNGGWVEDAGGVLGPEYVALINSVSETLKVKTTAEFAVVTVDNLGGLADRGFRRPPVQTIRDRSRRKGKRPSPSFFPGRPASPIRSRIRPGRNDPRRRREPHSRRAGAPLLSRRPISAAACTRPSRQPPK